MSHPPLVEDQDLTCSESAEARGGVSALGRQAPGGTLFGLVVVTDEVAKLLAADRAWESASSKLHAVLAAAAANVHCPGSCPAKVISFVIQPSLNGPAGQNAKGEWEWTVIVDWKVTVSCIGE